MTSPMTRTELCWRMLYSAVASLILFLLLVFLLPATETEYPEVVKLEIVIIFWIFLYTSYWWKETL